MKKINYCSKIIVGDGGCISIKNLSGIGQGFAHCVANRFVLSLTCHAACVLQPPIGVLVLDVYTQKNIQYCRIGPCLMRHFLYKYHALLLDFTKIYS